MQHTLSKGRTEQRSSTMRRNAEYLGRPRQYLVGTIAVNHTNSHPPPTSTLRTRTRIHIGQDRKDIVRFGKLSRIDGNIMPVVELEAAVQRQRGSSRRQQTRHLRQT